MVQVITTKAAKPGTPAGPLTTIHAPLIPLIPFGMSVSLFFVVTYMGCIVFYLLFPDLVRTHALLAQFLPGFTLLDWPSFFLGLVESFGFGWYVALIFGPLFNYFVGRGL
jgi:2TM family of unknown function (DUF5676)